MAGDGRRLIADIGGTNARFAFAGPDGAAGPVTALAVKDFPSFDAALAAFVANAGGAPFASAAIAAAGPRDGDGIRLTNAPWTIRPSAATALQPAAAVGIFNDLEAVALALPHLAPDDAETLAAGATKPGAPLLAFNVGTGLGAALAVPGHDGWRALATEAGHMRFAPTTPSEAALAGDAHSYEDILSGRGFKLLSARLPDPAERRRIFSGLLGRVAGDVALATGAWGGVFFCGGVLSTWAENVDFDALYAAFRDKGAMAERMAAIPLRRIVHEAPALAGLAHARLS